MDSHLRSRRRREWRKWTLSYQTRRSTRQLSLMISHLLTSHHSPQIVRRLLLKTRASRDALATPASMTSRILPTLIRATKTMMTLSTLWVMQPGRRVFSIRVLLQSLIVRAGSKALLEKTLFPLRSQLDRPTRWSSPPLSTFRRQMTTVRAQSSQPLLEWSRYRT